MNTDEQQTPPQNAAGLDRSGTEHGGPANTTDAERPVDQEGPIADDGSQEPPDPRVRTVPLDTHDGDRVVRPGAAGNRGGRPRTAGEQRESEREAPIGYDGLTAHGDRPEGNAR